MISLNILREESIKSAFYRLFDSLTSYAKESLTNIERFDYSIHEARKSFKRLRSLTRIYRHAIDDEVFAELNTLFRDAGRQLSHFRDIDAISECLHKIEFKNGEKSEIIESLKIQVDSIRYNNDEEEISKAINNVIADIDASAEIVKSINLPEDMKPFIKKGIKKIYDNGRTLYYKNLIDESDILMHELRKKVKQLWDVALIFNNGSKEEVEYAEEIHALSIYLGDYHDLVLTFEFVYEEKLILEEESLAKFKKILFKRKEKIAKRAFNQASQIFEKAPDIFAKDFLHKFVSKR